MDAIANFGPAIDDEAMERMEKMASSQAVGQGRRCALIAMARDADTLSNLSIESPDAFAEMLGAIEDFRDHAKRLFDAAEAAAMRMKIADCRDMNSGG